QGQGVGDVERQEMEAVAELVEAIDAEVRPTEVLRLRPLVGDKFILSRRQVHVGKVTGVLEPVVRQCFSGAIRVSNLCAAGPSCRGRRRYPDALARGADDREGLPEKIRVEGAEAISGVAAHGVAGEDRLISV